MKPTFRLQDLLHEGDESLVTAATLLSQKMAVLDCAGVTSLTTSQLDRLLKAIPNDWDFLTFSETVVTATLSNSLAVQFQIWLDQQPHTNGREREIPSITVHNLDRILQFLPLFERRGTRLYEQQQNVLNPYIYSSEFENFLQTLYDEGFILPNFDWGVWLDRATQYVEDASALGNADILTLQKLLTTHIKAERFNSGHLAQLIDNAHFLSILYRLADLRQRLATSTSSSTARNGRITALMGDITHQTVDAIVNTTNVTLDALGSVSSSIHAAAGPGLKDECRKLGGCAVGQAKLTRGFNLPALWVIHTVGPFWQGGSFQEDDLLAQCYRHSLSLAALCPIETIAFPSISTGSRRQQVAGFPLERAARIAVTEVCTFLKQNTSLQKVIFVCTDGQVFAVYSQVIKEINGMT